MKLETKFNLNDVVYVIEKRKYIYKDCNICENTGKITYKNQEYLCPECHGERKRIDKVYWQVEEFTINGILVSIKSNNLISILYKNNEYDSKYEYNIYKTKEEAQKQCDRLNQGLNKCI